MRWAGWLLILPLLSGGACHGPAPARPTVRVAIGMTVDQLRTGSTYPLKNHALSLQAASGLRLARPSISGGPGWEAIAVGGRFDFIFLHKGRELRLDDIGGDNILEVISTAPASNRVIDSFQIQAQNRLLTLAEALAAARRLNFWFVEAGFHPMSASDPEPGRRVSPFFVEGQAMGAAPYRRPIVSYDAARAAFLDPRARIIDMSPFELETDDAYADVSIRNSRRAWQDVGAANAAPADESQAQSERAYYVNLVVAARPTQRYWDNKSAAP